MVVFVKFWKVYLETVLDVLVGLLWYCRIASIMLLLFFSMVLFRVVMMIFVVCASWHYHSGCAVDAHLSKYGRNVPRVLAWELLTLNGHFDGVYFRFTASLRVEKERFGGNGHGDGAVNLLEKIVDDSSRWFTRFLSARIFTMNFFTISVTLHICYIELTDENNEKLSSHPTT